MIISRLRQSLSLATCAVALISVPAAGQPTFRVIYELQKYYSPAGITQVAPRLFYTLASDQAILSFTPAGVVTVVATPPAGYRFDVFPVSAANRRFYSVIDDNQRSGSNVVSFTPRPNSMRTYPVESLYQGFTQNLPNGMLLGGVTPPNSAITQLATVDLRGNITVVSQFPSGDVPFTQLYATDGNYYGVAWGYSGPHVGDSYVFRVTAAGSFTKLVSLPNGSFGSGDTGWLIQADDGNFYGTITYNGANGYGAIYQVTPAGQYSLVYSFTQGRDANPEVILQASDGNFYGATRGNQHCCLESVGVLYRVTKSGQFAELHVMNGKPGPCPCGLWTQGSDGILYGTAVNGGPAGTGIIFALDAGLPKPAPRALSFHPESGAIGTKVRIWGYNLLEAAVQFNGAAATDSDNAGPNYVWATVPSGASTGPITVTTPGGASTTAASFTVK